MCVCDKQMCFGANQSGLGCVWTDIAPNYSSSLNSIGKPCVLYWLLVAMCIMGERYLRSYGWYGQFKLLQMVYWWPPWQCFPNLFYTGNTIGAVAGILGPIIVAACTDTWPNDGYGWRVAFFITFALSCVSLILWFRNVKAEIVPVLNSPLP